MNPPIRLESVKVGDVLVADGGFTCLRPGRHEVKGEAGCLYVVCRSGKHFLDGQDDGNGILVGFAR